MFNRLQRIAVGFKASFSSASRRRRINRVHADSERLEERQLMTAYLEVAAFDATQADETLRCDVASLHGSRDQAGSYGQAAVDSHEQPRVDQFFRQAQFEDFDIANARRAANRNIIANRNAAGGRFANPGGVAFKIGNGGQANRGIARGQNNVGGVVAKDVQPVTVDPLTGQEQQALGKNNQGLLVAIQDAEKQAALAQKAVETAQVKLNAINEQLKVEEQKLTDINGELKKVNDRIAELEEQINQLQKELDFYRNTRHVVQVGVDEQGQPIWEDTDAKQEFDTWKALNDAKKELEELKKQKAELEAEKQVVQGKVDKLKTEQAAAQKALQDAKDKATAANKAVDTARQAARDKANQTTEEKNTAAAQAERTRRQKQLEAIKKRFDERKKYLKKALDALEELGVIDEIDSEQVIKDAEKKWTDAMFPSGGAVAAGLGADAASGPLNLGTVISITQVLAGLLAFRTDQLVPSHTKAHLDKLNGIVPDRLPWGTSDPLGWLVDHGHAKDRTEAREVKKEMDKLLKVEPIDLGKAGISHK